jgi:hypothetical protein
MVRVNAEYRVKISFLAPNDVVAREWLGEREVMLVRTARARPSRGSSIFREDIIPIAHEVVLASPIMLADAHSQTEITAL